MDKKKNRPRAADRRGYQRCKRAFDLLFSSLALIVLAPLMLLLAILVRLQDGGSALYSQRRLGRDGRLIRVWKIRSMRRDADCRMDGLTASQQEQYRREFKVDDDPRVTPLGSFLRRTSLDELPQLWNILRGEMSLVGPRPVVPEEIEKYSPEERALFQSVLPGLTGYWQVCAGPEDSYTTGRRQQMELHYAANADFPGDLLLIAKTFAAVVRKAKTTR